MLLDVVSEWTGIVTDAYSQPRMAEIKAGLDDTYFAWSGPTAHEPGKNGSAYYRIQGPKRSQTVEGELTTRIRFRLRDGTTWVRSHWSSFIARQSLRITEKKGRVTRALLDN